jgi:hypothetical protein
VLIRELRFEKGGGAGSCAEESCFFIQEYLDRNKAWEAWGEFPILRGIG